MKKLILVCVCSCLAVCNAIAQEHDTLPPGWWKIPKTDIQVTAGGYVKFDLIHDFNLINSPSFFDVSKIPTNGEKGTNSHLQANETRLFVDMRWHTEKVKLKTYVEGDFYGSGNAFRLRHAYAEINDKLLAGFTWSNFMDENIIPPTLDFEKPAAYAFSRNGILRWKQPLNAHSYFAIALEEPFLNVQPPPVAGKAERFLPDLTARYRITGHWGHVQLSAFGGLFRFRPETGSVQSTGIYGGNISGQLNFHKHDFIIYQLVAGPGIARYRGGKFAAPDDGNEMEPIPGLGATFGVKHFWTNTLSSVLVLNYGTEDSVSGQPDSDLQDTFYGAINLKWQFVKTAWAGIEYLHGMRTDINDAEGKANRLQLSVQVDINRH